jgi:hypothetical protein
LEGFHQGLAESSQQPREGNWSAVFGPRDTVHPDPELAGSGKGDVNKLDFEVFVSAIILDRNSQICFHNPMIKTTDMTLQIIVDNTLHGLEAEIRKTTFETINRLNNLGVPIGKSFVVVGDRFDGAYVLRFVDDQTGEPDVLYVSKDLKRQLYADKDKLEIRAV